MNLNFKANTSATPLNVPTGVYMAGYADRENGSKGIHDNIYTKALTVSNGEKTIIVISNDLLGVDEELVDKVVSGIKKEINIPEENIFICATHTHSAPHIINWEFDEKNFSCRLNKKLKEYIIDTMIKNALKSAKDLRQIRLAYGKSKCVGVASNRICKEGPVDDSVNVIFLIAENNLPLGVIVNYSCHPTVLGADNEYISADYPGVVQNLVEEYFKNNCVCMFINGACGNQSTRFTRKAQDFNEVKRMGGLVFKSVLEAYDNKEDKNNYEINGIKRYFKFPKKEIPDRKEAMEYYRRTLYDLNKAKNEESSRLSDGTIAGSTKNLLYGFKNMAYLGYSIEDVIKMSSSLPAKLSNVYDEKGSIEEGKDADFVILDDNFNVHMTYVEGKVCFDSSERKSFLNQQDISRI